MCGGRPVTRAGTVLEIHAAYDGIDRVILGVVGEIDIATASQLRIALANAISVGAQQIVVDLREVDFVSSEGLGCLAGASLSAAAAGSTLHVAARPSTVRRAIEVAGLTRTLRLHENAADVPSPVTERPFTDHIRIRV